MSGRRLPVRGDGGTSLIELVVSVSISTVLLVVVAATFSSSLRLNQGVVSRTGAAADARLAAEAVTLRLRVAVRPPDQPSMVLSASSSALTFYASIAAADTTSAIGAVSPTLVSYELDPVSRCFRESLTRPTSTTQADGTSTLSWPTSSRTSRCLAYADLDALRTGVFTYYASASSTTPLAPPTGTAALDEVRSVGLALVTLDASRPSAPPTTLRTRVTMTNRVIEDDAARRP